MAFSSDHESSCRSAKLDVAVSEELTRIYRNTLEIHVPSKDIFTKVMNCIHFQKNNLHDTQIQKLKMAQSSGYKELDITLMYSLLRNLCPNITPPSKGWGIQELPDSNEITTGDDIERIRIIRNEIRHKHSAGVSESDFTKWWTEIYNVCHRQQHALGGQYVTNLRSIECMMIDDIRLKRLEKYRLESLAEEVLYTRSLKISIESYKGESKVKSLLECCTETLKEMVDHINENTTRNDISVLYETFCHYLDLGKPIEENPVALGILNGMKNKIHWYARLNPNKTMRILAEFGKFTCFLKRDYEVSQTYRNGSIVMTLGFYGEHTLRKFVLDFEKGKIQELLEELLCFRDLLSIFDLNPDRLRILVEEIIKTSEEGRDMTEKTPHVAVIGGGLVGALNACFLAKRNFKVDVYERRDDIRKAEHVKGRSINLALSTRGRTALRMVGLEEDVLKNGIPMHARMIHGVDGSRSPILYGKEDQYIMSVDRRRLNEVLLTAAEENPNVTCHFEHKVVKCDFTTGEVEFINKEGKRVLNKVDLIVGNDGAFSAVRKEMMRATLLDFQQEYIPHGYMELTIPPSPKDEFQMEVNYLHIWPRNEYMMIALPNLDKSFTCTLFMPFDIFASIKTEEDLMKFFRDKFPDAIPLMGEESLKQIYMSSKPLPMVSIKCSPYHVKDKGVIMGDAAHAMVPFYGQGMNAGFEDCIVLDEMLDKYNNDFSKALPAYSEFREVDDHAICDLAMYNYVEMRKSVNSKFFLMRKKLDNLLFTIFPNSWVPLYTMVAFTRTRYHECIAKRKHQDEILTRVLYIGGVFLLSAIAVSAVQIVNQNGLSIHNIKDRFTELWESFF